MKKTIKVKVINEPLEGTLTKQYKNMVYFIDKHGFEYQYLNIDVIIVEDEIDYPNSKIIIKNKNSPKKSKKTKDRKYIIDLHWQILEKKQPTTDAWERFYIQKTHLIEQLAIAKQKNYKKIEVIHGIGDGVLQKELYQWLNDMSGIVMEENDFFREISGSINLFLV